jgi:hypothetical protein
MTTKTCAVFGVLFILTSAIPARAAIVEWDLENVVASQTETITGFFDYDTNGPFDINGNTTSSNYSITASVGGGGQVTPFTYTPLD